MALLKNYLHDENYSGRRIHLQNVKNLQCSSIKNEKYSYLYMVHRCLQYMVHIYITIGVSFSEVENWKLYEKNEYFFLYERNTFLFICWLCQEYFITHETDATDNS